MLFIKQNLIPLTPKSVSKQEEKKNPHRKENKLRRKRGYPTTTSVGDVVEKPLEMVVLGQAKSWSRLDLREREKRGTLREEKVRPASIAGGGRWASEASSCSHGYGD